MHLNEYQTHAKKTAVYPNHVGLLYTTLGLAGEAGELANKVKKVFRDDSGILTEQASWRLADELGDVLWYVAMLADELGIGLEAVAELNLNKLAARKSNDTLHGNGDER